MNKEDLIQKYESLEGVWNANGAETARQCFLRDLEQLNEIDTEKVTVPKSVADWIEYCKENQLTITGAFEPVSEHGIGLAETFKGSAYKCTRWALDNQNLFARAWLDGYEVEEEKRYYVRFKGMESDDFNYLNFIKFQHAWVLSSLKIDKKFRTEHTRKELEEAGFGWVFDCPGVEVEEVEE